MVMIVLKWLLAMLLTSVPFVFHYCIKPKAASSDKWRNFYCFLSARMPWLKRKALAVKAWISYVYHKMYRSDNGRKFFTLTLVICMLVFQVVNLKKGADNSNIVRHPEIEEWAKDMYKFVCERFGEPNIASFIVHLDETNPHAHCTMLPITENNKFSWKSYFGELKTDGLRIYSSLHNDIAKINQKYGLERGDRISETGARHRSTEEYHAELREKLMSENEQLSQTIEGQQTVIREQRATLSGLEKDIKHATARFKALQTMIANLESKKNRLLEEVEQLKRDRDSGKISAEEAKIRLDRIQKELEEVDEKIADKTLKLHTAELQLAQLQTKTLSAERKFEEVQKKLQKEVPLLSKATVKEMQQMGYMMMATDAKHRVAKYHEFLSSLPFEQRQVARQTGDILFDGSIAETIMDNAVQVTSIAAALYLGYLDAATKISQSGGGGGGPGTGWCHF